VFVAWCGVGEDGRLRKYAVEAFFEPTVIPREVWGDTERLAHLLRASAASRPKAGRQQHALGTPGMGVS
jgi:hypothetical protein